MDSEINLFAVLSLVQPNSVAEQLGYNETNYINMTSLLLSASEINETIRNPDIENVGLCGANFCPAKLVSEANPNLKPPATSQIYLINGIYLACMIAACIIVAVGVDSMNR